MAEKNLDKKFEGQISFEDLTSVVTSPNKEFSNELQGLLGIQNTDANVDINKLRDVAEQYLLDIFLSIETEKQSTP